MSLTMTPEERAMRLIANNLFLTLATADASKPWCAPLAFVTGPGPTLHFYSATESIHAHHLEGNSAIALAVFDSSARGDSVDGAQFRASCRVVEPPALDVVVEHYFRKLFPDPETHAWWYRPASAFWGSGLWRFYRIDILEAFVIDQEGFAETKLDRRTPVDLGRLLDALALHAEAG